MISPRKPACDRRTQQTPGSGDRVARRGARSGAVTRWQSLATLQQQHAVRVETPVAELVESDPPEEINDVGRQAIALLRRWNANNNDDHAARMTLIAVFGTQKSLGRMAVHWSHPAHHWLTDIAYQNGARLTDLNGDMPRGVALRSEAAKEMIKHRIVPDKRRKTMSFQAHAALLRYWREKRDLVHELRAHVHGKNAREAAAMVRSVELMVRKLEEINVLKFWAGRGE